MKYTLEITIGRPRSKVIELFDSQENLKKWQPELISFEHLSGEPGQVGARSRLLYQMGRGETEMIETITERKLPDEFSGTYEAKGVFNIQNNYFEELPDGKTRWTSVSEFKFKGFMAILAPFMKGAFKKQSRKFMERFDAFVSSQPE